MGPEVLVFQIDKPLRIAQRIGVELSNALDAVLWREVVRVHRNRPRDLDQTSAFRGRRQRMFGNEQLLAPLFALDDIIPALAKIALDVSGGWPLDQGMGIVPVMRRGIVRVTSQWRKVVMEVGIPAVIVA